MLPELSSIERTTVLTEVALSLALGDRISPFVMRMITREFRRDAPFDRGAFSGLMEGLRSVHREAAEVTDQHLATARRLWADGYGELVTDQASRSPRKRELQRLAAFRVLTQTIKAFPDAMRAWAEALPDPQPTRAVDPVE